MKPGERYSLSCRTRRFLDGLTGKRGDRLHDLKRNRRRRDVQNSIRKLKAMRDAMPLGSRERIHLMNDIFQVEMMATMAGL